MNVLEDQHFLSLRDLSRKDIERILDTAAPMRDIIGRDIKKVPSLRGKAVATVFYENSTRTRTSFEVAGKYLSADVVNLNVAASSVQKGETLKDTIKTLEAMGFDALVLRHSMSGAAVQAARYTDHMRIINAGDGINEHPTQGLLDLFTIREPKGGLDGLTIVIVGDILHSRVARSDIFALRQFDCQVRVVGPATLIPLGLEELGVEVYYNLDTALEGADVVNVLRIQKERQAGGMFPSTDEYSNLYMLGPERLKLAAPEVLVMHPGPINRGVEISGQVADGVHSAIEKQVKNGVALRMAILYLMMGGAKDAAD
jgi:aspartate carbamoyltransferase catalytic subunit